jgi:hypothetical protein
MSVGERSREDVKKIVAAGYFATRPKNQALRKHGVFQYLGIWPIAKLFASNFARAMAARGNCAATPGSMCLAVVSDALRAAHE